MHIYINRLWRKHRRKWKKSSKETLLTTAQQNLPGGDDPINVRKVRFSSCRCGTSTAIIILNHALMEKADRQRLPCMFTANIAFKETSSILRMTVTFQGNILWKMESLLWCLLKVTITAHIYWHPLSVQLWHRWKCLSLTCHILLPPLSLSNLWKLPCLGRLEIWGKLFWVEWNDLVLPLQNPANADQTSKHSHADMKSSISELVFVILSRGALLCILFYREHTATGSLSRRGKKAMIQTDFPPHSPFGIAKTIAKTLKAIKNTTKGS